MTHYSREKVCVLPSVCCLLQSITSADLGRRSAAVTLRCHIRPLLHANPSPPLLDPGLIESKKAAFNLKPPGEISLPAGSSSFITKDAGQKYRHQQHLHVFAEEIIGPSSSQTGEQRDTVNVTGQVCPSVCAGGAGTVGSNH